MKNRFTLIIGILFLVVALSVFAYPSFALCINECFSESEIDNYNNSVQRLTDEEKERYLDQARNYNDTLKNSGLNFSYSFEATSKEYDNTLNFNNGIIGYIQIPKIDLKLPIFHGTDESALSKGVAHLPSTPFPIGGESNHCVLAAHTAYSTQIFFDNIGELDPGDYIYIYVLEDTYMYKVRETNIVKPNDTSPCQVEYKKDLLSLVTCYPYGQNTHRLIVTSERVVGSEQSNINNAINNISDNKSEFGKFFANILGINGTQNEHEIIVLIYLIVIILIILWLLILLIIWIIKKIIKLCSDDKEDNEEENKTTGSEENPQDVDK